MHRLRQSILLAGALALVACERAPRGGSREEQASRLFGLPVSRVVTGGEHSRVASCAGGLGLVVPPRSRIEIPVPRGFHTLTGAIAICDPVGARPTEFRAEVQGPPARVLFDQSLLVEGLKPRSKYPFMATFWVGANTHVVLRTLGGDKSVQSAWLDLKLISRLRPATGVGSSAPPVEPPPDLPPPPEVAEPGRRRRTEPLTRNSSGAFWLTEWGWFASATSWGPIEIDRANGSERPNDGSVLTLGKQTYAHGVGMHAPGRILVDLDERCSRFSAAVGVDKAVGDGNGSGQFWVWADSQLLWKSDRLVGGAAPVSVDVDLTGRGTLMLQVTDADDGRENDWTDWAEAQLFCEDPK